MCGLELYWDAQGPNFVRSPVDGRLFVLDFGQSVIVKEKVEKVEKAEKVKPVSPSQSPNSSGAEIGGK